MLWNATRLRSQVYLTMCRSSIEDGDVMRYNDGNLHTMHDFITRGLFARLILNLANWFKKILRSPTEQENILNWITVRSWEKNHVNVNSRLNNVQFINDKHYSTSLFYRIKLISFTRNFPEVLWAFSLLRCTLPDLRVFIFHQNTAEPRCLKCYSL